MRSAGTDDDVRDAADELQSEGLAQLAAMVKRYRNSPSIILWSIGNEEWELQGPEAEQGAKIGASMVKLCHELDPTRVVSAAVNGDNQKGVSDAFTLSGSIMGLTVQMDITSNTRRDRFMGQRRRAPYRHGACTRPIRCATW